MKIQALLDSLFPAFLRIAECLKVESGEKSSQTNESGDVQLEIDVVTNEAFEEALQACPLVRAYSSEEMNEMARTSFEEAPYLVYFDPLDGSSIMDANFAVGSIVGVYETQAPTMVGENASCLVASVVAVYGPQLVVLVAFEGRVHRYRYEEGAWVLVNEYGALKMGQKIFSPGNLRAAIENPRYGEWVNQHIQAGFTLRYTGGMVPDVYHFFVKGGGIFTYPGMPSAPHGKLRLLYECAPMAYLVESVGGMARNNTGRILEMPVTELHQRTPIYLGDPQLVQDCCDFLAFL